MNIVKVPIVDDKGEVLGSDHRLEFEGELCPYIVVDTKAGKKVMGYELIKQDLQHCLHILESLETKVVDTPVLLNSLLETFFTKYGRCFVEARGRCVKLEAKKVFVNTMEKFKEHHEFLMNNRHNFSAHAGSSNSDIYGIRLALQPEIKGKKKLKFYIFRNFSIMPTPDAISSHRSLIFYIIEFVDKELEKFYIKIKKQYEKIDIDYLYKNAK